MSRVRVAVIGAGFSGIIALRHLSSQPDIFEPVAYEQSDVIGGTWVYTEDVGRDKYGEPVFPSMYRDMRTNIPKECMNLPDFKYDNSQPSFVNHKAVLDWLKRYASHFDVLKYIQFLTRVVEVRPLQPGSPTTKWEVITKKLRQQGAPEERREYDAVLVCNGHYSVPFIPNIPGVKEFQGDVIHSHDYRKREQFEGKRVVLLGAGFSGMDIGYELAKSAAKVILSHNLPRKGFPLPTNMKQTQGIASVKPRSVVLRDGTEEKVDAIILCTGYDFNLGFLSSECGISVDDGRVTPLFKHIFNIEHPTMMFIGIVDRVFTFCFHHQIKCALKILRGDKSLPIKDDMLLDEARDFEGRMSSGLTNRQAHFLAGRTRGYFDDLTQLANIEAVPGAVMDLYEDVLCDMRDRFHEYKDDNYEYDGEKYCRVISRI